MKEAGDYRRVYSPVILMDSLGVKMSCSLHTPSSNWSTAEFPGTSSFDSKGQRCPDAR